MASVAGRYEADVNYSGGERVGKHGAGPSTSRGVTRVCLRKKASPHLPRFGPRIWPRLARDGGADARYIHTLRTTSGKLKRTCLIMPFRVWCIISQLRLLSRSNTTCLRDYSFRNMIYRNLIPPILPATSTVCMCVPSSWHRVCTHPRYRCKSASDVASD